MNFTKLHKDALAPHRAHKTDAGADLFALEHTVIAPHSAGKVRTGIAVELEPGTAGFIWGKSSVESRGVKVMAGLIDADYRGEIIICLYNLTDEPFSFEQHRKVAQLVVQPVLCPEFEEAAQLGTTARGTGGFGSTGHK